VKMDVIAPDKNGCLRMTLHELMNLFGHVMYNGAVNTPFEDNKFTLKTQ